MKKNVTWHFEQSLFKLNEKENENTYREKVLDTANDGLPRLITYIYISLMLLFCRIIRRYLWVVFWQTQRMTSS